MGFNSGFKGLIKISVWVEILRSSGRLLQKLLLTPGFIKVRDFLEHLREYDISIRAPIYTVNCISHIYID